MVTLGVLGAGCRAPQTTQSKESRGCGHGECPRGPETSSNLSTRCVQRCFSTASDPRTVQRERRERRGWRAAGAQRTGKPWLWMTSRRPRGPSVPSPAGGPWDLCGEEAERPHVRRGGAVSVWASRGAPRTTPGHGEEGRDRNSGMRIEPTRNTKGLTACWIAGVAVDPVICPLVLSCRVHSETGRAHSVGEASSQQGVRDGRAHQEGLKCGQLLLPRSSACHVLWCLFATSHGRRLRRKQPGPGDEAGLAFWAARASSAPRMARSRQRLAVLQEKVSGSPQSPLSEGKSFMTKVMSLSSESHALPVRGGSGDSVRFGVSGTGTTVHGSPQKSRLADLRAPRPPLDVHRPQHAPRRE